MPIPAIFKVASEVNKVNNIASGDVSAIVSKGVDKTRKFNADKRIDSQKAEINTSNGNSKFDPNKRIKPLESKNADNVVAESKELVSEGKLYTDYQKRRAQAESSRGEWKGEPGKSEFIPDKEETREALKQYDEDSVRYDENYEPDFSKVAEETVKIDNMTEERYGKGNNFDQADTKLAEKWNAEAKEDKTDWKSTDVAKWVDENKLVRHERLDKETVDYVKKPIHEECKHYGGCAECRARDKIGDVKFDE